MTSFRPVTAERYDEFLNILPPALWEPSKGFIVGEPYTHRQCEVSGQFRAAYSAFVRMDGKFYEATAPMTAPEFRKLERADIRVEP
jgi:hypothetical protein